MPPPPVSARAPNAAVTGLALLVTLLVMQPIASDCWARYQASPPPRGPEETLATAARAARNCIAALRSGDIGFAESYIAGDWQTDDLAALLQLLIRNRDALMRISEAGIDL